MSGIFRDVYLYNVPKTSIRNHVINSTFEKKKNYNNAKVEINLTIDNRDGLSGKKNIAAKLTDNNGNINIEYLEEALPRSELYAIRPILPDEADYEG